MRSSARIAAWCALAIAYGWAVSQGVQTSRQPFRTLHSAREAHSLPYEEAVRAHPVHLFAVVTYYDPFIDARQGALFVHDSSGAIFVRIPSQPILPLQPGTVVDIEGVSGPGDYAPIVDHAKLRVVGQSNLPDNAPKATMQELLSGPMDGQWVEVEGMVHAVHFQPRNVSLEIETVGGPITATTRRETGADYDSLVDSLIHVRGNAGPVFNPRRQMVGVHLFFPSLGQIKVVQPAPSDPFKTPVLSLADMLRYVPTQELAHRVRVQGRVTLQWPGHMLCIQNGSDGVCMQTALETPVREGDSVDVVGFPAISAYKPTLEHAIFRVSGSGAPLPPPGLITADQAMRGDHDGQLVRIDGELIGQDHAAADPTLMLRSGKFIISAIFPRSVPGSGVFPWKDGSILRLTGICNVQFDSMNTNLGEGALRPESVHILLRSPNEVAVLHAPSWWTPQHALGVFAILGIVVLAAVSWIVILRYQVEQRTEALRDSRERLRHLSEHDALTSLPNRILLNDRLQLAVKRAERFGVCLGLLMVDVDGFKEVNDVFGHQAGDRLLCELANRLRDSVRETDTVARIGGDEFIVLLPDLRIPVEAETIAAKILAAASVPVRIGTGQAAITVSVGVTTYPGGGTDVDGLMQTADAAMYGAKARGKNGVQVYRENRSLEETNITGLRNGPKDPLPTHP